MRTIERKHGRRRGPKLLAGLLAVLVMGGCDTDKILEVIDPDLVTPESINQAELYWAGALGDFAEAAGGVFQYVGMFTDEFHLSGTFPTRIEVDERRISITNGTVDNVFEDLHHARVSALNAADLLAEEFGSDSRIGDMYNLVGYTYLHFAEVYCSGVPFGRTPIQGEQEMGSPLSTTQMFEAAIGYFDQAESAAAGSSAVQNVARLGRGRALLNLGQYDAAAAAVASVPADFEALIRYHDDAEDNPIEGMNRDAGRWSLSDREGINGVPFRSALDPRLPWEEDGVGFDESTPLYVQLIWNDDGADMPLANKLEARLIEAEAALNGGDIDGWLGILNDLRGDVDGLDDLTDPGTEDARARMHFEERAWWLFARGQRIADLRRMIRQYGFVEDDVFPTGQHFKGSAYGDQVVFPIPQDEDNNPNFTACENENA